MNKLIFGFHFNQPPTPYFKIVLKECYIPLTYLMLNSSIKATLNISGITIETALKYKEGKKWLKLLNYGRKKKLFEFYASTWSAEIAAALDKKKLIESIKFHIEYIKKYLYFTPYTFFPSERVLNPKIFDIIKKLNMKYYILEQQMIPQKYNHKFIKYKDIFLIEDSRVLKWKINEYIENHNFLPLYFYLLKAKGVFCYIEDAEVFRIWNIEKKKKKSLFEIENLLSLFEFLKKHFILIHPKYLKNTNIYIKKLNKKQSFWLKNSFEHITPPKFYDPNNYKNWFEFMEKSPNIIYHKMLLIHYKKILNNIYNLCTLKKELFFLYNISKKIYYLYRFEFGCPGLHKPKSDLIEGIRKLDFIYESLKLLLNNKKGTFKKDFLKNGKTQILLINKNLIQLRNEQNICICKIDLKNKKEITNFLFETYFISSYFEDKKTTKNTLPFINFKKNYILKKF